MKDSMNAKKNGPRVGIKAPDFLIETPNGKLALYQLAERYDRLVLTTQDSYRYHPN
jgi:hypothetical protein